VRRRSNDLVAFIFYVSTQFVILSNVLMSTHFEFHSNFFINTFTVALFDYIYSWIPKLHNYALPHSYYAFEKYLQQQ
jgi:hypothetical protein